MEPTLGERARQPRLVVGNEAVDRRSAAMLCQADVEQEIDDVGVIRMDEQLKVRRPTTDVRLHPAEQFSIPFIDQFAPTKRWSTARAKLLPLAEGHRLRLPDLERNRGAIQLEHRVCVAVQARPDTRRPSLGAPANRRHPRVQRLGAERHEPSSTGERDEIARRLEAQIQPLNAHFAPDRGQIAEQSLDDTRIGIRLDNEAIDLPGDTLMAGRNQPVDLAPLHVDPRLAVLFQRQPMRQEDAEGERLARSRQVAPGVGLVDQPPAIEGGKKRQVRRPDRANHRGPAPAHTRSTKRRCTRSSVVNSG